MPIQKLTKAAANLGRGPIARGSLASITIRITFLALGFVQAAFTARLLGPEGYGVVAVALSVVTIVATFTMLGFGPLAVREVARLSVQADWARLRGFLKFSGMSVIVASLLAGGIIAVLAGNTEIFEANFRREIAIASMLVLPLAVIPYLRGVLQGFGRIVSAQIPCDLLRPVIMVAILGALLVSGRPTTPVEYMALLLFAAGLAAMLAALILGRVINVQIPAMPAVMKPSLWGRSAAPFLSIIVLGVIGTEANNVLLGWLAGPKEAGLYQPVARLAPIMLIANEAIAMPLAPRIAARWHERDLEGIRKYYRLATRVGTGVTVVVILGMVLLSPFIFSAFGDEFFIYAYLLIWIGVAQIFNSSTGAAAQLLAMAGVMRLRIYAQCLTLVVQLGLGLILIKPLGAEGAAAALVAAILVWSLANWWFAKSALGIDTSLIAGWHPKVRRANIGVSMAPERNNE